MGSVEEKPVLQAAESDPGVDERRAVIERVAASEQFSRSARLRDFLLYVGRQSLKQGCREIHEQEIGAKVFGRPDSYDRTADNIVRVNATELRKRIESYFESTGANEPLIFEIPRGGYTPVFRRRLLGAANLAAPSLEESPPKVSPPPGVPALARDRTRFLMHAVWAMVSLALGVACVVLVQQNRTMRKALKPWEGEPAVETFWTGFLGSHQQTDIVLPDDSASVIEDITGRPNALGNYLSRNYNWIQTSDLSADRKEDLYQILNHNLVTFGAVRAAQHILNEIPAPDARYLTLARYYTADEIKRNNVVLIGGKKADPWDHLFDDEVNFVTDYDDKNAQQFVRNRNPKPGEQAIYDVSRDSNSLFGYSVIAYLPNPSRTGNSIILAGTDSDATGAAAEFLTSEEQMERFRNILHVNRFPYFEVLLKTSRISGTSFNAELIAYRSYPDLH
ncbi:MAG TPA: hypothetical protein VGG45_17095 [Terracidiphilus sp.]|jgi:hypothetical protein